MFNKTLLSSVLLAAFAMQAAPAIAAEELAEDASATVLFSGLIESNMPGENLIITGEGGRDLRVDPARGTLDVESNGMFTTADRVILEARDYTPEDTELATEEEIGDINEAAVWTVTDVAYQVGGYTTKTADISIKDSFTGDELATYTDGIVTATETTTGTVNLDIENTAEITDVAVEGMAHVSVSLTAGLSGV
ncbi:hypothetical protein U9608_002601 [Vibrio alginolyticus]|uniref:hypothetical protein n=1 Tax=Vibrio TaxID=662 RepID=UPI00102DD763|nr:MULTISPECIES: hypothetical protein [Vibrio]EMB9235067.1 hypothetical protein [Vibrio alginolyticus]MCF7509467.1 hypothetical protein [Vibrio sp. D54]RZV20174.1 hypothetical protein EOJ41_08580 [Vibrio alginolyticus]